MEYFISENEIDIFKLSNYKNYCLTLFHVELRRAIKNLWIDKITNKFVA